MAKASNHQVQKAHVQTSSTVITPRHWKSKCRRLRQLSAWHQSLAARRQWKSESRRLRQLSDLRQLNAATHPMSDSSSVAANVVELSTTEISRQEVQTKKRARDNSPAPPTSETPAEKQPRHRAFLADPAAGVIALRASSCSRSAAKKQPTPPAAAPPVKPKVEAADEIQRILSSQGPEEVFDLAAGECDVDELNSAWKRIMLILHPDKLQRLDDEMREAGLRALECVEAAKQVIKNRCQEVCAEVPVQPMPEGHPRLIDGNSGARKYEIKWKLQESQDPTRPVEKYEVWGPKYFSEKGEPYDWTLLATLPPLQSHFVLVEEAPTQQDVMWAADRVRRSTCSLSVSAVNGKGSSEALTFEMPWEKAFKWLQGTSAVICPRCCQLSMRRGAWSKCGGCSFSVPADNTIVIKCPECRGEVLWSHGGAKLSCTCCFKQLGGATAQNQKQVRPTSPSLRPSQPPINWNRGGGKGGGRR